MAIVRTARFFQLSRLPSQPLGPDVWQAIPVYKRRQRIKVALIDSPDCAVETLALHSYRGGLVDLLVSRRHPRKDNPFSPQNTPVPQVVEVYRPTLNSGPRAGHPAVYFNWIRSQILSDPLCTQADIAGELGNSPPWLSAGIILQAP